MLYHGTPVETLEDVDGVLDFCTTEDFEVAEHYATFCGEDGFVHEFNLLESNIATEEEAREELGLDDGEELYDWFDAAKVRQDMVDAGFDGVEFSDYDNDGSDITTIRIFNKSVIELVDTTAVQF